MKKSNMAWLARGMRIGVAAAVCASMAACASSRATHPATGPASAPAAAAASRPAAAPAPEPAATIEMKAISAERTTFEGDKTVVAVEVELSTPDAADLDFTPDSVYIQSDAGRSKAFYMSRFENAHIVAKVAGQVQAKIWKKQLYGFESEMTLKLAGGQSQGFVLFTGAPAGKKFTLHFSGLKPVDVTLTP